MVAGFVVVAGVGVGDDLRHFTLELDGGRVARIDKGKQIGRAGQEKGLERHRRIDVPDQIAHRPLAHAHLLVEGALVEIEHGGADKAVVPEAVLGARTHHGFFIDLKDLVALIADLDIGRRLQGLLVEHLEAAGEVLDDIIGAARQAAAVEDDLLRILDDVHAERIFGAAGLGFDLEIKLALTVDDLLHSGIIYGGGSLLRGELGLEFCFVRVKGPQTGQPEFALAEPEDVVVAVDDIVGRGIAVLVDAVESEDLQIGHRLAINRGRLLGVTGGRLEEDAQLKTVIGHVLRADHVDIAPGQVPGFVARPRAHRFEQAQLHDRIGIGIEIDIAAGVAGGVAEGHGQDLGIVQGLIHTQITQLRVEIVFGLFLADEGAAVILGTLIGGVALRDDQSVRIGRIGHPGPAIDQRFTAGATVVVAGLVDLDARYAPVGIDEKLAVGPPHRELLAVEIVDEVVIALEIIVILDLLDPLRGAALQGELLFLPLLLAGDGGQ